MPTPDVFISYAGEDRSRVEPIALGLAAKGLQIWWDREMGTGDRFRDVIQGMLDATSVVIVFWSRSSIGKQWVIDEAEEGVRKGILLPVRLERVEAPLGLRGWHYLDLFDNSGVDPSLESLAGAIDKLLSGGIRPREKWWPRLSDSVTWSTEATERLGRFSLDIGNVVRMLQADERATAGLTTAVNEVYRTYAAVRDAVDEFTSLRGARGIRIRPLRAIAKGRLAVEVGKGRGHCTAIGLAYWGSPGIRNALAEESPSDLEVFDEVFAELSTADGDVFAAMAEITGALAGEASAIANHLAAGQKAVALDRLEKDTSELETIEAALNRHMTAMMSLASECGIVIAGQ